MIEDAGTGGNLKLSSDNGSVALTAATTLTTAAAGDIATTSDTGNITSTASQGNVATTAVLGNVATTAKAGAVRATAAQEVADAVGGNGALEHQRRHRQCPVRIPGRYGKFRGRGSRRRPCQRRNDREWIAEGRGLLIDAAPRPAP